MPATKSFQQYLGAHLSVAGGLHKAPQRAAALGCTALQIFTKNGNTWKERVLEAKEIQQFKDASRTAGIREIAAHTSYLINIAAPDNEKWDRSVDALTRELVRAEQLAIPYVVQHPGNHMGAGTDAGIKRIAEAVCRVFDQTGSTRTRLLLETTAGQGSGIGHRFAQLADILERIACPDQMGICLDTCHIFGAGYDIRDHRAYRRTMERFDAVLGLENLHLIHLNDSKKGLRSRVDRHEHIGRGAIGEEGFRLLMQDRRLQKIPKILETPKGKDDEMDAVNLALLRRLAGKPTVRELEST